MGSALTLNSALQSHSRLAAILTYLLNSAWMHISPAHLPNVCLMIGVYQDSMCSSDNKRSGLRVLPVILRSKASFQGSPAASARKGHVSQNGHAAICQWENVESLKCIKASGGGGVGGFV